jgi:hypothetical protein
MKAGSSVQAKSRLNVWSTTAADGLESNVQTPQLVARVVN